MTMAAAISHQPNTQIPVGITLSIDGLNGLASMYLPTAKSACALWCGAMACF
jgi:hypothetical protein